MSSKIEKIVTTNKKKRSKKGEIKLIDLFVAKRHHSLKKEQS